ncbi:SdpA family antimicrobial peptide system protein (plasmid) [Niallia sp. XMNu-256]|uniref:SdpA family antimicrobial peptide system protein n=1 Tax=Niallia sp. XMNu-256 TaxID=3082444 RepID=UPI0030D1D9DD
MHSMNQNKLAKWFYTFFAILLLVVMLSIISALPQNPLTLNKTNDTLFSQLLPQGWGFFSKNPREEFLNVYSTNSEISAQWPNMKLTNLFGVDRTGRAQGTELGLIIPELQETDFKECNKDIDDCIADMKDVQPIEIYNSTPKKTLCGEQYITLQEPMPWAWSSSTERTYKSSKLAKVELVCTKN